MGTWTRRVSTEGTRCVSSLGQKMHCPCFWARWRGTSRSNHSSDERSITCSTRSTGSDDIVPDVE